MLKSFWSCSHINELLSTLHVVTHQSTNFVYSVHQKFNLSLKEFQESNNYFKG